jgi:hypothetical protein
MATAVRRCRSQGPGALQLETGGGERTQRCSGNLQVRRGMQGDGKKRQRIWSHWRTAGSWSWRARQQRGRVWTWLLGSRIAFGSVQDFRYPTRLIAPWTQVRGRSMPSSPRPSASDRCVACSRVGAGSTFGVLGPALPPWRVHGIRCLEGQRATSGGRDGPRWGSRSMDQGESFYFGRQLEEGKERRALRRPPHSLNRCLRSRGARAMYELAHDTVRAPSVSLSFPAIFRIKPPNEARSLTTFLFRHIQLCHRCTSFAEDTWEAHPGRTAVECTHGPTREIPSWISCNKEFDKVRIDTARTSLTIQAAEQPCCAPPLGHTRLPFGLPLAVPFLEANRVRHNAHNPWHSLPRPRARFSGSEKRDRPPGSADKRDDAGAVLCEGVIEFARPKHELKPATRPTQPLKRRLGHACAMVLAGSCCWSHLDRRMMRRARPWDSECLLESWNRSSQPRHWKNQ